MRINNAFSLLLLLVPSGAWSCATCFGTGDNASMVKAFYIGGAILLGCVFSILIILVRYIRRSERSRAELFKKMGLMDEGEKTDERWPL